MGMQGEHMVVVENTPRFTTSWSARSARATRGRLDCRRCVQSAPIDRVPSSTRAGDAGVRLELAGVEVRVWDSTADPYLCYPSDHRNPRHERGDLAWLVTRIDDRRGRSGPLTGKAMNGSRWGIRAWGRSAPSLRAVFHTAESRSSRCARDGRLANEHRRTRIRSS